MKSNLFLMILFFLLSCNEDNSVNNDIDKTIFEKILTPSNNEQILESSDGIRVIIPAGAINTNLEIKLVKLANPPKINNNKLKLGTNIFKISLTGELNFNSDIQLRVKYDKNNINSGFTALTGVKGLVYDANQWLEGDYEIDNANEEIVFFILHNGGKQSKDQDILLESPDMIFGDGYSTTDTGQDDEFLAKLLKSKYISVEFAGFHTGINNGEWSEIKFPLYFNLASEEFTDNLTWNGNQFSADLDNGGKITGSYDTKSKTLNLHAFAEQTKSWLEVTYDTVKITSEIILENVPYDYDWMGMFYEFGIDGGGNELKKMVKKVIFTRTISNLNVIKTEEYISTDYSKNAWIEIKFLHN